jgi:hypothetical protein
MISNVDSQKPSENLKSHGFSKIKKHQNVRFPHTLYNSSAKQFKAKAFSEHR